MNTKSLFFFLGIFLFFMTLSSQSTFAAKARFYLGTLTHNSLSQGIYTGTLDIQNGQVEQLELAAVATNPSFLAFSPDGKTLAAILEKGARVGTFSVNADAKLTKRNEQPSGGVWPCHIRMDRTGHFLMVANYGSGNVACFPLDRDGSLGERADLAQFTGSGPNPERQKASYAHSIYSDPKNRFIYACDLGSDQIWIFHFDPITGKLTPHSPPTAHVPPGSGPRHLAFNSTGTQLYVVNELSLTVTRFSCDPETGNLTGHETVSVLPPDAPMTGATSAEIGYHPSGKWLYVSTRGCDTLSVLTIGAQGILKLTQTAPSVVKKPRSFALDPTGRWLLAAGEDDNRLVVFSIDPSTGKIRPTSQSIPVGEPTCVLFTPIK